MATYSDTDKDRLLATPITDVLAHFGKRTDHVRRHYWSPFRDESTPSFSVDTRRNVWYDFGDGSGGGVLTLVTRLSGCRPGEAYDVLACIQGNRQVLPVPDEVPPHRGRDHASIEVLKVCPSIRSKVLRSYLEERRIPEETASRWCSEVIYRIPAHPGQRYVALGFRNDGGGWVLRSPTRKRCTSSVPTTILCGGGGTHRCISVFEGFFDFLSWTEYNGFTELPCDVCVLNSVVNVRGAADTLRFHQEVDLYLDNDAAGRNAVEEIRALCGDSAVRDLSSLYAGYGDFAEMFQHG